MGLKPAHRLEGVEKETNLDPLPVVARDIEPDPDRTLGDELAEVPQPIVHRVLKEESRLNRRISFSVYLSEYHSLSLRR